MLFSVGHNQPPKSIRAKKYFSKMIQKLLNHLATIILPSQIINVSRFNRIFYSSVDEF
jgi:hypothetical protein